MHVVQARELGTGDILYVSDLIPRPDSVYPARAKAEGIRPLDPGETAEQRRAITRALRPDADLKGYRIAPYPIEDFIY